MGFGLLEVSRPLVFPFGFLASRPLQAVHRVAATSPTLNVFRPAGPPELRRAAHALPGPTAKPVTRRTHFEISVLATKNAHVGVTHIYIYIIYILYIYYIYIYYTLALTNMEVHRLL